MQFRIDRGVRERFGDVSFGALKCYGLDGERAARVDRGKLMCRAVLEARTAIACAGVVTDVPLVQEWRSIYTQMGCGDSKVSSVESLYSLVNKTGALPEIHPVVDIYNAVSVLFGVPMAGYDLDRIEGTTIALRLARKGEEFRPLGLRQIEKTKNGEVVYADEVKVLCRYWNNRDSDFTKITESTRNILFIFDGAPSVASSHLYTAARFLDALLRECGVDHIELAFACEDCK